MIVISFEENTQTQDLKGCIYLFFTIEFNDFSVRFLFLLEMHTLKFVQFLGVKLGCVGQRAYWND